MTDAAHPRLGRRVLVLVDLAGYAKAFTHHDDATMASFTQAYYGVCAQVLEGAGGRIVKFVGDACLAVFPVDHAQGAVEAVRSLDGQVSALAAEQGIPVGMGANLHLGEVMEGLFGPEGHARYDVIGAAMNDTALMGRGPVLRLSRTLWEALAGEERARWRPEEAGEGGVAPGGSDVFTLV